MSTDFEEALIAYAQSLDAAWATDKDRERLREELVRIIDAEFGDGVFAIALKRLLK